MFVVLKLLCLQIHRLEQLAYSIVFIAATETHTTQHLSKYVHPKVSQELERVASEDKSKNALAEKLQPTVAQLLVEKVIGQIGKSGYPNPIFIFIFFLQKFINWIAAF